LHRSILTGLFACILTIGVTTPAWAEAPADVNAPAAAPATVPSAAAASTAAAPTTTEALPTDGADFAMWNVEPPKPQAAPHPKGSRLARLLHVQRFASGIAARGAAMASVLTRNALRFLGVPYAFGGTSTGGFDCSGYVQHVFAMIGLRLPRTADAQFYATQTVSGGPLPGDLVFFQTYTAGPSHVGISLGGDRFVHASSSRGVTVSSLYESYWSSRYLGARRVTE
jgi:cell wall-associated NlpC family hydrolase